MTLESNPFATLGASPRDPRRRLADLAEEQALLGDEATARDAVAALTNPRRRLAAEVAWLPGLAPKRTDSILQSLRTAPEKLRWQDNLPDLARANVLAAALPRVASTLDSSDFAKWILELAEAFEDSDSVQLLAVINEERQAAGVPEWTDLEALREELDAHRRVLVRSVYQALDQLPSAALVSVVTDLAESATEDGTYHAPAVVEDLVHSFELAAQSFLNDEASNVRDLIQQLSEEAGSPATELEASVSELERVVRNWDQVAQPMQVIARSRGTEHALSNELAGELRGLAIELFNEHDHLELSKRITELQREVFAELDRVVEVAEEDAATLDDLADQRERLIVEMREHADAWAQEITYAADVGVVFKDRLRISPDGIEWKGRKIALEDVTATRWGGTSHSVNGIPTGTTYHIHVLGERTSISIELKKAEIYEAFMERFWKAIVVRLLTEMLEGLRDGRVYQFGSARVRDDGIELERKHWLKANERVYCPWRDLQVWSAAGSFCIASKSDSKLSVALSYQEQNNVHVLEAAIRALFKQPISRMSGLLG